jgi:hypothetical protein
MKKATMVEHRDEYRRLVEGAQSSLQRGLFREAIETASSSWDYIDGMMQYERKYEDKEHKTIEGVEIVLEYAPLLFDLDRLEALETMLKDKRKLERNTSHDLGEKLAKAKALMWQAHGLWDHLEKHPHTKQDGLRRAPGGDQDQWRQVGLSWEEMGLVSRSRDEGSYRLSLVTQMDALVLANPHIS